MTTEIPTIPPIPVALPEGFRLISNEIRRSKKPRTLDCGCQIASGVHYHAVLYKAYGQIIFRAGHIYGCMEPLKKRAN